MAAAPSRLIHDKKRPPLHFKKLGDTGFTIVISGDPMASNHHGAPSKRVCAHTDVFTFHYRNKSGLRSDLNYARATLCGACGKKVTDWLAYRGKGFHKVDLPKLQGRTPGLISWGNRVRIERLRTLGPLMSHLQTSTDPLAGVVLKVLELMFQVPSASYWVDVERRNYSWYSLQGDVSLLLRGSQCQDNPQRSPSAVGFWLEAQPAIAQEAVAYVRDNLKESIAAQAISSDPEKASA